MRSEMVFRAQGNLANRYELCQAAAKVTRRLHFLSSNTQDAINDAFGQVAKSPVGCLGLREKAAESYRVLA